jgi:hypothetical protein
MKHNIVYGKNRCGKYIYRNLYPEKIISGRLPVYTMAWNRE